MTDVILLTVVIGAAALAAWWWRARDGHVRSSSDGFTAAELAAVGAPRDAAVLLSFTAPGCSPCASARAVLDDVAAQRPGVVVVAVDVGDVPDVARAHHVMRAPTVFIVAPGGRVRGRVGGVPVASELLHALDPVGVPAA